MKVVKVERARRVLGGVSCASKAAHTCKRRRSRSNFGSDPGLRCWVCTEYSAGDRGRMLVKCAATCADDLVASEAALACCKAMPEFLPKTLYKDEWQHQQTMADINALKRSSSVLFGLWFEFGTTASAAAVAQSAYKAQSPATDLKFKWGLVTTDKTAPTFIYRQASRLDMGPILGYKIIPLIFLFQIQTQASLIWQQSH